MDALLHIANVLYLFSYSVRDIMALRVLTVTATLCLIPYFVIRPEPLLAPVVWNLLFTGINLYRIFVLYRERQPVKFDSREFELYRSAFGAMRDRQFAKLLKIGKWLELDSAKPLIPKDGVLREFIVICDGSVEVRKEGKTLAKIGKGEFIGETCLVTEQPVRNEVVCNGSVRCFSWQRDHLKSLFSDEPSIHASFQTIISRYLIRKIPKLSQAA